MAANPQAITNPPTPWLEQTIPWLDWFRERYGWTEFDHDPELSKGWKLTASCQDFTTVIGNDHPWCGMSLATALNEAGYSYPVQCETALKWKGYGDEIDWKNDGIPKGAIIVLDFGRGHSHVTCCWEAVAYNAHVQTVKCLGGNQDNAIRVKEYSMNDIVYVGWPVLQPR